MPIRPSEAKNKDEKEMVDDSVGDVVAGMDVVDEESSTQEELFGDVADADAQRSEMGNGHRDESHDDGAEEDCGPKRVAPDPGMPTQSEIDDHNVDHLPFRSWCVPCVEGKATGEQHRCGGPVGQVSRFAFDYMFITKDKVVPRDELTEEDEKNILMKILVAKDSRSRAIFAHVVRRKGVDEEGYAVKRLAEDIEWLGYTRIILKSDGEPAIVRLLKETLRVAKTVVTDQDKAVVMDQVTQEHPPRYDSRSNGSVENGVRLVKGHLRTMKSCPEMKIRKKIPEQHPLMSWLVEHTAWLLTVRLRGEDGKTAYERVRGRPFTKRLTDFGEEVLYKLPSKGPEADARGTLEPRWKRGCMLGFSRSTNEYY